MHPTDKAARIAGAVYLSTRPHRPVQSLVCSRQTDRARQRHRDRKQHPGSRDTCFRLGIVGELFGSVIFILLGVALYRLLSGVNKTWARLMVAFVLVSAAVGFLNVLNNIAALTLFRGADFLAVIRQSRSATLWLTCSSVCTTRENS